MHIPHLAGLRPLLNLSWRGWRRGLLVSALCLAAAAGAQAQSADLVLNHTDSPDPGPAGGVFTYTLRIDNNGPNAATGVTLSDTTPPGSIFLSATPSAGSCPVTPPVNQVAPAGGDTISCTLGNLAATQPSSSVSVVVRLRLPTAGVYTNRATASSSTNDQNTANNSWDQPTTVVEAADLKLDVTPSATTVAAGEAYTYSVVSSNLGPDPLAAAATQSIRFTVPPGSIITEPPSGAGWTCTPSSGYPLASGDIACSRPGPMASGASTPPLVVPAVSTVAGNVAAAFTVSATKGDGTPMPDADASNNTVDVDIVSTSGSDVGLTKTVAPAVVELGQPAVFTLTARHLGGEPPGSTGTGLITVTDTLPAGLGFVSASGAGWTCSFAAPTVSCTRPGPYAGGNFTDMPPISVTTTVNALGALNNSAEVSIPENDPVPGNNTATIGVTGSNDADLRMSKATTLNPVVPNQPFAFTLGVRNLGPLAVRAGQTITVTDTLPPGLVSTGTPTGNGWTCTVAGQLVTCTRPGPLALNADAPNITVPVLASGPLSVTNTACLALSGAGPVDSAAGNDCAIVPVVSTTAQANLAIAKVAS
ncbi:MAG TPA: DUF11 domain-containing protein, partial [Pseudorhodoferax sp.]|nr:DUF11 domain-containing protein [Pseudorhodoferax sp.]